MAADLHRHVAVVLAAGGSKRLGHPKQLLTRDGETLLHRAARLAVATAPLRTLVIVGAQADAMRAALADLPVEVIENDRWRSGMASSLRLAARVLERHAGPTLILGCDQPALEAAQLVELLAASAKSSSGCAAVRHGDGAGSPAVVPPRLLAGSAALQADRGLGAALRTLSAGSIALLEMPWLHQDINTVDDLVAAIKAGLLDADNAVANTSAPTAQD